MWRLMCSVRYTFTKICKLCNFPPLGIRDRITKHVEEDRAEELLGQADGLLPFAPDVVSLIEDGGDVRGVGGEGFLTQQEF